MTDGERETLSPQSASASIMDGSGGLDKLNIDNVVAVGILLA